MKPSTFARMLFLTTCLLLPTMAQAVPAAGQIARLTGDSIARARAADGSLRSLATGDSVYSGDAISTGKDTNVEILFADGSRCAVGSRAEFVVDRFIYGQGGEEDAFHSRVVKGVFRFVSGLIGKSKGRDIKISVVVATIGIRGTQLEGEVTERHEKDGVSVDASAKVVLLEPEEKGKETSIVVSNEFGSVVIDKPGYGTEIPDEKSPPSPVRKMQLRTVENILRSIRSSVRQSGTARPRM